MRDEETPIEPAAADADGVTVMAATCPGLLPQAPLVNTGDARMFGGCTSRRLRTYQ